MQTKIISAFPGVGKTTFFKSQEKGMVLDSDSSQFSWVTEDGVRKRNPEFPRNYIRHIQSNIGTCKYILVSSHKEVREALTNACLFFHLVYPSLDRKEEFIQRYVDRGSPKQFIDLLRQNYDAWIRECMENRYGCNNVMMTLPNLADEIEFMEDIESMDA
jgi:hypothetical protein